MGQLISTKKPEAGGDPCELWQTVADLIDELNDLSVTVLPGSAISVVIADGDIQLDCNGLVTQEDARNLIPGYGDGGDTQSGAFDATGAGADGGGS